MKILPEKWRTVTGSIGLILAGIALILKDLASEAGIDLETFLEGGALISMGLTTFGIGKKIERGRTFDAVAGKWLSLVSPDELAARKLGAAMSGTKKKDEG